MAFPWLSETGFELGTRGHFDAETLASGKLDFVHYSRLCVIPGMPAPYRGAFCMRADLSVSTTDCHVQETGAWDIAQSAEKYFRFMFWIGGRGSQTLTMADTDAFSIFQLWSATSTVEATISIQNTTASGVRLAVSELADLSGATFAPISLNRWHTIELFANWDTSSNDGTLDCTLDGGSLTQITTLTQAAATSGVLGVLDQDAGTTAGICLFDDVIADDAQIFQPYMRYPQDLLMTISGHAFVGPGIIDNVSLLAGGGTNQVLTIFDTDRAIANNGTRTRLELKNVATNSDIIDPAGVPVHVWRGCFVEMTGSDPRAMIKIRRAIGWGSDGAVKTYAQKRKAYKQDT